MKYVWLNECIIFSPYSLYDFEVVSFSFFSKFRMIDKTCFQFVTVPAKASVGWYF